MQAYVFLCAYTCVYMKARIQHWVASTLFSIPFFKNRVSPWPQSPQLTRLAGKWAPGMDPSLVSSTKITAVRTPGFYMGTRNPNSCPQACSANALLTEPSTCFFLNIKFFSGKRWHNPKSKQNLLHSIYLKKEWYNKSVWNEGKRFLLYQEDVRERKREEGALHPVCGPSPGRLCDSQLLLPKYTVKVRAVAPPPMTVINEWSNGYKRK